MHDYAVLACVEEFAPLSQQQVCDRIGLDRADMVSIIDRLEAAGSLERERDSADRRRYCLRMTPADRRSSAGPTASSPPSPTSSCRT